MEWSIPIFVAISRVVKHCKYSCMICCFCSSLECVVDRYKTFYSGSFTLFRLGSKLTHHGRRSRRARERRAARRIVQEQAWRDREIGERINILTPEQISILTEKRGNWLGRSLHVGADYVKGEVITDTLGRGTLQRVPGPKSLERELKRMQRLNEDRRFARVERSQAVEEPNGHAESAEEPMLEVFQPPRRRVCGKCGRKTSRNNKSGFCIRCFQGEMKKLREAGTA